MIGIMEANGYLLKKKTEKEYATQCPKCGGTDRFCIFLETDSFWCRQCNVKGDVIDYYRVFENMDFPDACRAAGEEHKLKQNDPPKNNPSNVTQLKPRQDAQPKIVATYDYHGTDYTLIYQAVRMHPKEFRLRRPGKTKKWVWDMKGIPKVIYKLPDIMEEEVVFFVEGEKDADNLWKQGYPATTTPHGCSSIDSLQKEHSILEPLANKKVVILPDNDPPGKEYAEKVARYIYSKAQSVKVVELPVPLGGDVSDFINGMGKDFKPKFKELVKKADKWEPDFASITIDTLLDTEYELSPAIISRGVLHDKENLLLAGEGGVGKSMLRLELAIHLAMGWSWLDYFDIPKPKRVLICQYENSERTEKIRLQLMMKGMEIIRMPKGCIQWVKRIRENRPDVTLKSGVERMHEIVAESNPDVVIYDCLTNLHSAPENDNVRMRNVMDVFSDINNAYDCATVMIHHFGKPYDGVGTKYRVRGASAITDWADCVLTYSHKPHRSRTLRLLENTKMRNAKELQTLLLERNGNFLTRIVEDDTIVTPEQVGRVLETLGGEVPKQKHLIDAICVEADCSEKTARIYIKEALERKKIISFKEGRSRGYRMFR